MLSRLFTPALTAAVAVGALVSIAHSSDSVRLLQGHGEHGSEAEQKASGDPYLLDVDPVTGKSLGSVSKQVVVVHEGREFRFASARSADTFKAAPEKYVPAVDAKLIEQQMAFYPLTTCVVSGAELGQDAVDFVYMSRLVRVSSKDHQATFLLKPTKYVAKLDSAVVDKQVAAYGLTTCVVSGEEFGSMGDTIDHVAGNRLVRFCCMACLADFNKDPLKYLAKVEAASKRKAKTAVRYTCPMHSDVVKEEPGRCSKCGMDLVKEKKR